MDIEDDTDDMKKFLNATQGISEFSGFEAQQSEKPLHINYSSDSAWSPVTRYRKRTGGDHTITQKESVVCPDCPQKPTQSSEDDESSNAVNGSRLYTNGAVTVCANDDCDYHINHGVQIKRTQFDTETIGPFQDESRDRYEHTGTVILNGGFPHAHAYGDVDHTNPC